MAQVMVNFRMDAEEKKNMEQVCKEMGISVTTAFKMFAAKVSRERRIPFEVCADPFYSKSNMDELRRRAAQIERGEAKFVVKTMEELEAMEDHESALS